MTCTTYQAKVLELLDRFVAQRSGLEFANYGDVAAFRAEQRSITRDLHDYRAIRSQVHWRSFTPDQWRAAFQDAYSGRLSLRESTDLDLPYALDYCTGQYFPTEYRRAACAVLASLLWADVRDNCMPCGANQRDGDKYWLARPSRGGPNGKDRSGFVSAGEWMRAYFRATFGRAIANRWFQ